MTRVVSPESVPITLTKSHRIIIGPYFTNEWISISFEEWKERYDKNDSDLSGLFFHTNYAFSR